MNANSERWATSHVPALDGLRAIAVMLVLAYHADAPWMGGGFLGVSVFFTLSGFLITSLLVNDWTDTGRVGLRRFWSRRFRRLLPASWLTVAAVAAFGMFGAWDTAQLRALRTDIPWSLAELVNWHFLATGTNYGADLVSPSPLQHYWSLAVEQQFYVVLPVVVIATLALARRRNAASPLRWLGAVFVVLAACSASANAALGAHSADRAYFGTDTRAAELLIGALLAVAVATRPAVTTGRADGLWPRAIGPAGLAGLAVIAVMSVNASVDDGWLYPWGLMACAAATATVIHAARHRTVLARVLAWRPFTALGRISYGVYLVHWPVYLLLTPERLGFGGPAVHVLRIGVTVVVAAASYRWIEHPIRTGERMSRSTIQRVVPVAAAAILVCGFIATSGLPPVADYLQPRATEDLRIVEPTESAEVSSPTSTTVDSADVSATPSTSTPPAGQPTTSSLVPAPAPSPLAPTPPAAAAPATVEPRRAQRVLLVGDSIAASLETELGRALSAAGVSFAAASSPGCGVVTGFPTDEAGRVAEFTRACDAGVPERQRSAVSRFNPDLVVVLSSWEITNREVDGRWYQQGTPEMDAALRVLYAQAIDRLARRGAVVALTRLPDMVDGRSQPVNPEENERSRRVNDVMSSIAAERPGTVTVGLDDIVCPAAPCPTEVEGLALRAEDGRHFADPAAARWVAQRWAQQILAIDLGAT